MDKDKTILEKFTETMKGLADSASEALKSEEPPKTSAPVAAYMPLGAEGLVSDPLLVPPVAAQPVRKKRRVAKKAANRSAPKKSARKAVTTSAPSRSKKSAKTAAKTSAKKAARASAKKRSKKAAKRRR